MKMLILLALLLTAGCGADLAGDAARSAKAETTLTRMLAGKVAGATQLCISQRDAAQQTVIDERTILFGPGPGRLYRTDIPGGCPGLDDRATLIRRSPESSLCSGQIFEVRDNASGTFRGACTFGDFTEYHRAGA